MFGKTRASGGKPLRRGECASSVKKPQVWGLSSGPFCCEATMLTAKPLCCLKHYSFSHVFPVLFPLCHSLPSNEVSRCLPITVTVTNRINPNHLAGPCLNLAAWHGIESSPVAEKCLLAQAFWKTESSSWALEASFVSGPCPNTTPFLFLLIFTRLAWLWDWACAQASVARLIKRFHSQAVHSSRM